MMRPDDDLVIGGGTAYVAFAHTETDWAKELSAPANIEPGTPLYVGELGTVNSGYRFIESPPTVDLTPYVTQNLLEAIDAARAAAPTRQQRRALERQLAKRSDR